MKGVEKLATGVPGLETITHGGIPKGRTTLIAGTSGTCKSVLGLQMLCNLAHAGHKSMVCAVEEDPEDIITTAELLGFRMRELVEQGKLVIADLTRPMDGPMLVSGDYDLSGLIHRVETAVKAKGIEVVLLDSSTALFSPQPPE